MTQDDLSPEDRAVIAATKKRLAERRAEAAPACSPAALQAVTLGVLELLRNSPQLARTLADILETARHAPAHDERR